MLNEPAMTFISYSRKDEEFAFKLARSLKDRGVDIWIDQLSIKAGQNWDTTTQNALVNSDFLIVILSSNSIDSFHVLNEINFFISTRKPILPILLVDCQIPMILTRVQHIDFRRDYDNALVLLLNALGVLPNASSYSRSFTPVSNSPSNVSSKKICILGASGTGKTSIVRRLTLNTFDEKYISTVGVQVFRKRIDGIDLALWDLAGFEMQNDTAYKSYLSGMHGAVFVGDLSRPSTFDYSRKIAQEVAHIAPDAAVVLCGNKLDLVNQMEVPIDLIDFFIEKRNGLFVTTSAKTGDYVEIMFRSILNLMLAHD